MIETRSIILRELQQEVKTLDELTFVINSVPLSRSVVMAA